MYTKAKIRKKRRLYLVLASLIILGIMTTLSVKALKDTLVFFYVPSDLNGKKLEEGQIIRIGGLVAKDSLKHHDSKMEVHFIVTDLVADIKVVYTGILPDLFREGQGTVARGSFQGDIFYADSVLAKHDENYMPKKVSDALKESGRWRYK